MQGQGELMMTMNIDSVAAKYASAVAQALLHAASRSETEADFRREAARILEEVAAAASIPLFRRDEFTVASGRVDSLYNRLIVEYKRPGVLSPTNHGRGNRAAIEQVQAYILDVAQRERRQAHRLAGVVIDGFHFLFVRRSGEGWVVDEPLPVTPSTTERFLRLFLSLSFGVALVPDNLLQDFGPRTIKAARSVRALYSALDTCAHPLVSKLFEQWKLFFAAATDYREWATRLESKDEFRSLVRGMGLDPRRVEAPKLLFALHTYYALLIKLLAYLAATRFASGSSVSLPHLTAKEGPELRAALADLERGGLFKKYGIRNFLEGDFFGWYLVAWNQDIAGAVSDLIKRLAEYDPGTLELAPEHARDLLKKLYHNLLPREVRHTLGEYYTPDWLAERLIRQTLGTDLGNERKRVLDPACGSGTFLVLLIRHIRKEAARKGKHPTETLEAILQNVVGFDLNPLAVIAARTNYLLALGDLLKARRGDIDIPVYQADSILTPERVNNLFDGQVYLLKTAVGTFRIPACCAERHRISVLANTLEEAVEAGLGEDVFLQQVRKTVGLHEEELAAAADELRGLYRQLRELHEQGLDGVWARIIKNAFAPFFLEPCHYIVGNPPWVNWENLPDEYRLQTRPLWHRYGLFPHGGMDTILGKGKKDISMLMTYVCVHRYLRPEGKLGFVLSQSLFKTSGAGQGFRRFRLPDGTMFGPLLVEDMVDLKPFEKATNRPVVAIFMKGRAVRYPVPYSYWKRSSTGRGSAVGFDTPYEAAVAKITRANWYAQPIDRTSPTSSWLTARRRALRALEKVLGRSAYQAHEGANTGGANGVYWVEIIGERPNGLAVVANVTEDARRKVATMQAVLEAELLYPLLRGRDVTRWQASPSLHILMTQDPFTRRGIASHVMEARYPKAYSYLSKHADILQTRAAFRRYYAPADPYWSMFNVSPFTFAPWKVVWRELANEIDAAVVGHGQVLGINKPVIPDHTCVLVDCTSEEEAHYLCALINSSPARLAVRSYIILHPDPHVLNHVRIPKFSATDPLHLRLAELSQAAHRAVALGDRAEVCRVEDEIDQYCMKLWGLTNQELAEIRRSLEEA